MFTFIEIMVVVIIIGILAAIVMPKFFGRTEEAKVNSAHTQLSIFSTALDAYQLDNDNYPTTPQGLQALVAKPNVPPIDAVMTVARIKYGSWKILYSIKMANADASERRN